MVCLFVCFHECCTVDKMACLVKIFVWILLYVKRDEISGVEICPYVEECVTPQFSFLTVSNLFH